MRLTALTRYPVKSCRGQDLEHARVEPWGLAGDRRWAVIGEDNEVVTARTEPRLVLVDAVPTTAGLSLRAPGAAAVDVPWPTGAPRVVATVFRQPVDVSTSEPSADAWFSAYLGRSVRLVCQDDPTVRPVDSEHARPGDRVSMADGYPMLLASEASLAALNELIGKGPRAAEGPMPMRRFRPNFVVDASTAWEEDTWRRVRVGAVEFRVTEPCARCVLTLVDPDTAAVGREPLATLVKHRRVDGQSLFAVNLVPAGTGEVHVGDQVEVIESVESPLTPVPA